MADQFDVEVTRRGGQFGTRTEVKSLSSLFDAVFGPTAGLVLYRDAGAGWIASTVTGSLGVPSGESGSRTLTAGDNGKNLICTGSLTFTVNTGLGTGFGCAFKGTVAFTGSATVNDVRTTGAANPWCALMQTAVDTYDVVGDKA